MPIFEYQCPHCLAKLERYTSGKVNNNLPLCKNCDMSIEMEQIEYSLVAKRNPEKGIQN